MSSARTIAAAAACVLALGAATASADVLVTPPAGWQQDRELAARMTPALGTEFAGLAGVEVVFAVYRAPAPGAVLYVTHATAKDPGDAARRDAVIANELEALAVAFRGQGTTAKLELSNKQADSAKRQLEAALRYRDDSAQLVKSSRTLVVGDGAKLVSVTGDCMIAADAAPALLTACEGALATLDPGIATDKRIALSITDAGASTAAGATSGAADATGAGPSTAIPTGPGPTGEPARLDDGSRAVLPPIAVAPAKRETDMRPVYVGLGLIVLAALFLWNRKRRERFDREDRGDGAGRRDERRDEDADDLHSAAASGDDDARRSPGDDR